MADDPEDDEPETFVQKAVKIGLITIPIMMYISWAYKKFVPCPKQSYRQTRPIGYKVKKIKKNKGKKSRSVKQENEAECKPSRFKDREPSKHEYLGYIKRSAGECCKRIYSKGFNDSSKTDGKTAAECSQSSTQSEAISPEAFDKLFEQHFEKCVDEFKQHKKQMEEKMKLLREDGDKEELQKRNYLQCMANLNIDKDFECDKNFYSKDTDTPYVVKNYKCKTTRGATQKTETNENSYLECLTDLNMDKLFEDKPDTRESDSCPKPEENKSHDKYDVDPGKYEENKTKQYGMARKKEVDPCEWGTQPEDTQQGGVSNIYTNAKSDDCGCDPHTNTIDTNKHGTVNADPCERKSNEDNTDDNALKNFWHASGPPKGLRTGCRADGCQSSEKS